MRCSQIRRRINDKNSDLAKDKDLQNHISTCQKCAVLVKAELDLRKSFTSAGVTDDLNTIPWSVQKARVETEADHIKQRQAKGFNIMKTISKQFTLRPKLSFSLCMGLAVLLLITMIPFKIERSIGYEVAIAGVNKDLAMDSEKVTMLLKAIGCDDASFNLGECEATCELKISELKSEDDIKLVVAAFDKMGHCSVEDVSTVEGEATWSLMKHATTHIKLEECNIDNLNNVIADSQIQFYVDHMIANLGDSCNTFTVWTCDNPDSEGNIAANICANDSFQAHYTKICGGTLPEGDDGNIVLMINGERVDLSQDDENLEQKLKELGLDIEVINDENSDGKICKMVLCDSSSNPCCDSANSAAKSSTPEELPEGYSLAQNYPNPFNPITNIRFNIPTAQHVTLEVINILGQRVKSLVDNEMPSGSHTIEWDATNDQGEKVTSGMYFYRLVAGDNIISKKMTLLK